MKRLFIFSIWMVILTVAIIGCTKDNGNDPNNPDNPDNPAAVMQDVALSGTVKDTNGNPLGGVNVTTGSLNATTGNDGTFSFAKAGTVDDRVIMQYKKNGYFTLTRSCDKDSSLYVEAMLYPQGNSDISLQTTFDAATAKTLQIAGMKIDFPASSVVSADGKAYSGNVHANVLYLAPDNANFAGLMPGGDLTCLLSNNDEQALRPYGITDVALTDDVGNPLEIKADAGVQISFPIPAAMTPNAPSTLTFWSFDEVRGVWTENGTLTLQGNVYKGAVKHFSPDAFGEHGKKNMVRVQVLKCDKPIAGVYVWIDDGWPAVVYSGYTNSGGYCSIPSISDNTLSKEVTVFARYGTTKSMVIPPNYDGYQIVLFNFDCNSGHVITLNLKPGPNSYSFIVECVPAMPEVWSILDNFTIGPAWRLKPDDFTQDETGYGFICEGDQVDADYSIGKSDWNADFTQYTYIVNGIYGDWSCKLKLMPINEEHIPYNSLGIYADGAYFFMDYDTYSDLNRNWKKNMILTSFNPIIVDTVRLGSNNPVSLHGIPYN